MWVNEKIAGGGESEPVLTRPLSDNDEQVEHPDADLDEDKCHVLP